MSDHDEDRDQGPLTEALRTLYAAKAEASAFEPLQLTPGTGPTRRRRWVLPVAAAVVLLAGIGVGAWIRSQPTTAIPEPVAPTPTTSAFTGGGEWSWVERPARPVEEDPVTLTIDGVDYFLTLPFASENDHSGSCLPPELHRYRTAEGAWESLPEGPDLPAGLCPFREPLVMGDALYVTLWNGREVSGHEAAHLAEMNPVLVFQPATDTWALRDPFPVRPRDFASEFCVGLDGGYACLELDVQSQDYTGAFQVFDLATESWRELGSAELAGLPSGFVNDAPRVVDVDGAERILMILVEPVVGADPSSGKPEEVGEATVALLDPTDGGFQRLPGHSLPFTQLELLRDPQVLAPGVLYAGPKGVLDGSSTATFLDLRSGSWWELAVPARAAYPDDPNEYTNYLDSAEWAKRLYGDELASFAVIRDYLYDPLADRWLSLPKVTVTPPDQDAPEGDEMTSMGWFGSHVLRCDIYGPGACFELTADPLPEIATDLTHDQVLARQTDVRGEGTVPGER